MLKVKYLDRRMHFSRRYSEWDDDCDDDCYLSDVINNGLLAINDMDPHDFFQCELVTSPSIYTPPISPSSSVDSDTSLWHSDNEGQLSHF